MTFACAVSLYACLWSARSVHVAPTSSHLIPTFVPTAKPVVAGEVASRVQVAVEGPLECNRDRAADRAVTDGRDRAVHVHGPHGLGLRSRLRPRAGRAGDHGEHCGRAGRADHSTGEAGGRIERRAQVAEHACVVATRRCGEEPDERGAFEGARELAREASVGIVLDAERALDPTETVGRAVRGLDVDRERPVEVVWPGREVGRAGVVPVVSVNALASAPVQERVLELSRPCPWRTWPSWR